MNISREEAIRLLSAVAICESTGQMMTLYPDEPNEAFRMAHNRLRRRLEGMAGIVEVVTQAEVQAQAHEFGHVVDRAKDGELDE